MTNYVPQHSVEDMKNVTIDFIVEYGIALIGFVTILVIVWIFILLKRR